MVGALEKPTCRIEDSKPFDYQAPPWNYLLEMARLLRGKCSYTEKSTILSQITFRPQEQIARKAYFFL
jgi:hypothetical protein